MTHPQRVLEMELHTLQREFLKIQGEKEGIPAQNIQLNRQYADTLTLIDKRINETRKALEKIGKFDSK